MSGSPNEDPGANLHQVIAEKVASFGPMVGWAFVLWDETSASGCMNRRVDPMPIPDDDIPELVERAVRDAIEAGVGE